VSDLPGKTSAWDSDETLRRAVDAHPGECWLVWVRGWDVMGPQAPIGEDRSMVVPSRLGAQEKKDAGMLLRGPLQVTSHSLQSTLTFSLPRPACPGGTLSLDRRPPPRPRPESGPALRVQPEFGHEQHRTARLGSYDSMNITINIVPYLLAVLHT